MMSKDIHKWTDGRYTLMFDEHTFFVWDNEKDDRMCALETTERLNMQQASIDKLDQENADLLGARIKAQEEWEKCTDKLKEKILEQQDTIKAKNEYQQVLEAKIRKLKNRIKILEKAEGWQN